MFKFLITSVMLGIGLSMDACAVSMTNGFSEPKMKTKKILLIAGMFGFFQGAMPLIGYFIGYSVIEYIEKYIPWIALILLGYIGGKMLIEALKENKKKKNNALLAQTSKSKNNEVSRKVESKGLSENSTDVANLMAEDYEITITATEIEKKPEKIGTFSKTDSNLETCANAGGSKRQKLTFKTLFVQAIATSIDALSVGLTIADYTISNAIICACIIALCTFVISFVAVHLGKKFGTKLEGKAEIIGGIILILIGLEIFLTGIIK